MRARIYPKYKPNEFRTVNMSRRQKAVNGVSAASCSSLENSLNTIFRQSGNARLKSSPIEFTVAPPLKRVSSLALLGKPPLELAEVTKLPLMLSWRGGGVHFETGPKSKVAARFLVG